MNIETLRMHYLAQLNEIAHNQSDITGNTIFVIVPQNDENCFGLIATSREDAIKYLESFEFAEVRIYSKGFELYDCYTKAQFV